MNRDRIEGAWKQIKGKAHEKWGTLLNDDDHIRSGRRLQTAGRIQARHGRAMDESLRQIRAIDARTQNMWGDLKRLDHRMKQN